MPSTRKPVANGAARRTLLGVGLPGTASPSNLPATLPCDCVLPQVAAGSFGTGVTQSCPPVTGPSGVSCGVSGESGRAGAGSLVQRPLTTVTRWTQQRE